MPYLIVASLLDDTKSGCVRLFHLSTVVLSLLNGWESSLLAGIRVKAENGSSLKKAEAVKNDNIVKSVDVRTNKYSFHLPTRMSSVK